jgi:hypothetical protein
VLGVEGFEGMVAGEVDERVIWPVTCLLAAPTRTTFLQEGLTFLLGLGSSVILI